VGSERCEVVEVLHLAKAESVRGNGAATAKVAMHARDCPN
jgi:hypothetical protein